MKIIKNWLASSSLLFGLGVLLPVYCVTGCHTTAPGSSVVDERILEVWKKHETVVKRAINGKQRDEEEFVDACLFFEKITGISIHVNIYTFGFIPEAEAANDLKLIRIWYQENSDRLYWDEATRTVKVQP